MILALPFGVVLRAGTVAVAVMLGARAAGAQTPATDNSTVAYSPITGHERVTWVVDGSASPSALAITAATSAFTTARNWPKEWRTSWGGFGRRFGDGEAAGAVSSSVEAGLGALWGEDPRYRRSGRHGIGARLGYSLKAVALAPRADGRLRPAWGRFTGDVVGNAVENCWLPPSVRTPGQSAWRIGNGLLSRWFSNVWDEFSPDLRRRLPRRLSQMVGTR
jgi:hypothetical protein